MYGVDGSIQKIIDYLIADMRTQGIYVKKISLQKYIYLKYIHIYEAFMESREEEGKASIYYDDSWCELNSQCVYEILRQIITRRIHILYIMIIYYTYYYYYFNFVHNPHYQSCILYVYKYFICFLCSISYLYIE